MSKLGHIEIIITGYKGNLELAPDNYDIRELISMLQNAENLLYAGDKKKRPVISYRVEEGSVKHILTTSLQFIISLNAIIGHIKVSESINDLEITTARAFEKIQKTATKNEYEITLKTSVENSNEITIDKSTYYYIEEEIWVDAEFYLYGKITKAGGKGKSNIHLSTDEHGVLIVDTTKEYLANLQENLLYKSMGIRVSGKQNLETGEVDRSTLKFMELVDYEPKYDEKYIESLREEAEKNWIGKIDPNEWLDRVRGRYDA